MKITIKKKTVALFAGVALLFTGIGAALGATSVFTPPCTSNSNNCLDRRLDAVEGWIKTHESVPPTSTTTTTAPPSTTTTVPTTTTTTTPPVTTTTPSSTTTVPVTGFPDASNTGAKGTLTKRTGTITLTAGQTLENVELTGNIDVKGNGVTIRNVKVNASGFWGIDVMGTGAVVEDVTIVGSSSTVAGVLDSNGSNTFSRLDISKTEDGVKIDSNSTLQDSYVHDLYYNPATDTHNDALQFSGHGGITIAHNTLISPTTGTSAILMGGGESRPAEQNSTIRDNFLAGGGWTFYGPQGATSGGQSSNVKVTGNRWSTMIYPNGGKFGPATSWEAGVGNSNVWSDNKWIDGPKAGQNVNP